MAADNRDEVRLQELYRYRILNPLPEDAFNRIIRIAIDHYRVPIALISLVDRDQQWFKATVGIERCQAERYSSFCAHVLARDEPVIVPDALTDPLFRDNPLMQDAPSIRFYAGAPIIAPSGHRIGTVCIMDRRPRTLPEKDLGVLLHLSYLVAGELDLRVASTWQRYEHAMIERVTDAIIAIDQHLNVTFLNPAACRLYHTHMDSIGQPIERLFHARFHCLEEEKACWQTILRNEAWTGNVLHVLPGGSERLVDLTLQPIVRADGGREGLIAFIRDVTAQRREDQRRKLLEGVVVHANDSIVVTEEFPEGPRIVYVNEAFTRMTGYEAAEVIGRTPRLLQGSGTDPTVRQQIRQALENWEPIVVELQNYRKDGTPYWIEMSLAPHSNQEGQHTHWIAIQRDITERRQIDKHLRLFESAVAHSNDALLICRINHTHWVESQIVYVNAAYVQLSGHPADELMGRTLSILYGTGLKAALQRDTRERLLAGKSVTFVAHSKRGDGSAYYTDVTIKPVHDVQGAVTHWVSVQRDVTREQHQQVSEGLHRDILEMAADHRPLSDVLDAVCRLLSHHLPNTCTAVSLLEGDQARTVAVDNGSRRLLHDVLMRQPIPLGPEGGSIGLALQRRERVVIENTITDPTWLRFRPLIMNHGILAAWSEPILTLNGQVLGALSVYARETRIPSAEDQQALQDTARLAAVILDRYSSHDAIQRMAMFDSLTGLPNRAQFTALLHHALLNAQDPRAVVAVALLDLNRFKQINDTMGHPAGDELLRQVGRRLRLTLKDQDVVARMGGDEFTLILPMERPDDTRPQEVLERLQHALAEPFIIEGQELFITASFGVAISPEDGITPELLLSHADAAMYQAKRSGGGIARFDHLTVRAEAVSMEADLHRALERHELEVYFQPTWNAHSRTLHGAEALLRWNHPRLGTISPTEFIPLAENTGLIVPIGTWVIHQACALLQEWQHTRPDLHISVNLSACQLRSPDLPGMLVSCLIHHGVSPQCLTLEVTESVLVDVENAELVMAALADTGVKLALDDFGTGYSSLSYLHRFAFSRLKIDRSFVQSLHSNASTKGRSIIRAIVALAHSLELNVTAEGVEAEDQAIFLEETNCDQLQGHLLGEPVSRSAFNRLFQAR